MRIKKMNSKIFEFESKKEKYIFFGIIGILVLIGGSMFYPMVKSFASDMIMNNDMASGRSVLSIDGSPTPKEYYDMFQCSCCGKSIDANCCGMAKQRKAYVDQLLLEGLDENEIVHEMVKKFGFDVLMDQSKEQEIRDYIKSIAPENPPIIEIENSTYDFGIINQADGIVTTLFTIKNVGGNDLIIENMDTSCMCTSATLIYNGEEGPKFGMSMHGDNPEDFELVIAPGESAQLKVYYDPMAHGKQKKPEQRIVRTVSIISNDPVDFQKKVRIELTQILGGD